jgi:hypothetical protein
MKPAKKNCVVHSNLKNSYSKTNIKKGTTNKYIHKKKSTNKKNAIKSRKKKEIK